MCSVLPFSYYWEPFRYVFKWSLWSRQCLMCRMYTMDTLVPSAGKKTFSRLCHMQLDTSDVNVLIVVLDSLDSNGVPRDPFYKHSLTIIPTWISNHMHNKVWDEITNPLPNFNSCTIKFWELINNFTPYFIMVYYYLSMLGFNLSHVSKGGPRWLEMVHLGTNSSIIIFCQNT